MADRSGRHFARSGPRRRAAGYPRGLLGGADRKDGWQLAEQLGDPAPDGVRHLLARAGWDAEAGRDEPPGYARETGSLKRGGKSVGVARPYSGTAGRIESCQVGAPLGYATRHGRALPDRAPYLPKEWSGGARRRAGAGVPEAVRFATRSVLARQMSERAVAAGVRTGYAVRAGFRQARAKALLAPVPADGWHRLSCGGGAKGPRPSGRPLIRRSVPDPGAVAHFACGGPPGAARAGLARVAGTRWAIGGCSAPGQGQCGLGEYEVRSWAGWHRHVTPRLFALAVVAATRSRAQKPARRKRGAPGSSR